MKDRTYCWFAARTGFLLCAMALFSAGAAQEFVAGESLVVPKGFTGTWKMLGNFRELIVIERQAYEEAYGTGEE